jgi:hypothetical protein
MPFVDVNLAHASLDAPLKGVRSERVGAVQGQPDIIANLAIDSFQTIILKLDASWSIVAVDVSKCRSQHLDARLNKRACFLGRREQRPQVGCC